MKANLKSPIGDKPGFARFVNSIERYKFGDPVTPFFKAVESFGKCEKLHRRAERAKVLGLPKSDYYEEMAMLNNRHGLKRLEKAKEYVKKAIKMYPNIEKKCKLLPKEKKEEILNDCDIMFKNEIFEMDLTPEKIKDIWAEYGKIRKIVDEEEIYGLTKYGASKLDELTEARTDLEKGRKLGNPSIGTIIAIIIAAVLVVSVIAVIDCYNKHGCQWVEDLWKDFSCALQEMFGVVTQECYERGFVGIVI